MDHPRLDDALEAGSVNEVKKSRAATLRRRNLARPKPRHGRLGRRGGNEAEQESGSDSGLDSGSESDDEATVIPKGRPISVNQPSATLRLSSAFGFPSRPTIRAAQPTALRLAPATFTRAARPTGLGLTLLAADGADLDSDSGIDSGIESLSDDSDSDDEATTTAPPATTKPPPGETTATVSTSSTSELASSTTIATTSTSTAIAATVPTPATGNSPVAPSTSSDSAGPTTLSRVTVGAPASDSTSSASSQRTRTKQTATPSDALTLAPDVTAVPLSTSALLSPQLASTATPGPIGTAAGAGSSDQALGSVTSARHEDMTQAEVAGAVVGVLAGVTIIVIAAFFFIRRMRRRSYQIPGLRVPFSRSSPDHPSPRTATSGSAWAAPWSRNLWGAASNPSRSTVSSSGKANPRTNSEMLDELIQASYDAENGGAADSDGPAEKSRRRQTDLESQSPPSPGSFRDENFIDEKSYTKLEGGWPIQNPPKEKGRPKTPGPVGRWLDGILTPRQSTVAPPPALVPAGKMATKWQPEPVAVPKAGMGAFAGLPQLPLPAPAFAKGSKRDRRMTATTATSGSSVVW